MYPAHAGLIDQYIVLVGAQGHAVGKKEAVHHDLGLLRCRVVAEQSAGAATFKKIECDLCVVKSLAGVGEPDAPVAVDIKIVDKAQRFPVELSGQHGNRAIGIHMEQAGHGVSNPEAVLPIGSQTERPPVRIAYLQPLRTRVGPQHGTTIETGVEPALGITGYVLGGSADRDLGNRRQRPIGRKHAGQPGVRGRGPNYGTHRRPLR